MKNVSLLKIYISFDEDRYLTSDWFTNKSLIFSEINDEEFEKLSRYICSYNQKIRQRGGNLRNNPLYCLVEQCNEEDLSLSIKEAFEFFEKEDKEKQEKQAKRKIKAEERAHKRQVIKEEREKQKLIELKKKYEGGK